ncbi:ABC transporter permease [Cryobacterium roopkundense]|uniref:Iron(III) transport system permease protein n=1 Tax=Cryobacterium roopkundense TaxID=1001240 RepID=A0A7W9E511_9MICO|nr:iron ABC transporter permease [Cryobacterium roopkundense]MBB5643267.1 iron(III) transport system permease protein [Cryobacterium roopkundense]
MSVLVPELEPFVTTARPRGTHRFGAPGWLLVLAALCASAAAIPLVYLVVRTSEAGLAELLDTLLRPRVLQLTLNSVLLAASVTVSCLILGTASAWVLTRVRLPAGRALLIVAALPLAVPSYLAAYGWLVWLPALNGFWAAWFVMTAVCTPYVTLPVAAALRGASGDLEAVARTLGRGPLGAFRAATWPQIRPAAISGALLVCLYSLSDFGLVSMLRFQTLTWGINAAYGASFDRNQAALLALVLVVLALIVVAGERKSRGQVERAGGRSTLPVHRAGRWLAPLLALILLAPVAGIVVPLVGLVSRLLDAATLRAVDVPRLLEAVGATLGLALAAALVAAVLALPIAALAARYRGRLVATIEAVGFLGHGLPGIVVGLSLVFFALAAVPALYQTSVVLVFAYVVLFMPRAIGSMRSGIAAVPGSLTDVSRMLGHSPLVTWWRVTARLALPGIGVGALLVAISVMKELPATLLLRPTGISTLSTELWSRTSVFEFGGAAPYAAALVVLAAVPTVLLSGIRGVAKEKS